MIKSVEETEIEIWQSRRPGKAGINHVSTHLTIADNTSVESLMVRAHPGDLMGVRVSFPGVLTIKTIKT